MTDAAIEMPRYVCHKQVWALKIADIQNPPRAPTDESDGSVMIVPADEGYAPLRVDHAYMRKHQPQIGGYYVVYDDGYKSFSPREAFESGYTRLPYQTGAIEKSALELGAAIRAGGLVGS